VPTYDYHCSSCNATYELRQGFDAAIEHLCEECKKGTAKRVLHAPRVLFKGSGFYVTDSKSKSSAGTVDSPSSSSDSKSESKTPAATETAASSSDSSSSD
jgi:putative FmdB family regulatory protein